jgi:hypothetical protein
MASRWMKGTRTCVGRTRRWGIGEASQDQPRRRWPDNAISKSENVIGPRRTEGEGGNGNQDVSVP